MALLGAALRLDVHGESLVDFQVVDLLQTENLGEWTHRTEDHSEEHEWVLMAMTFVPRRLLTRREDLDLKNLVRSPLGYQHRCPLEVLQVLLG